MAQADEGRGGAGTIVIPRNMPSGSTAITTVTMERVGAGPAWSREGQSKQQYGLCVRSKWLLLLQACRMRLSAETVATPSSSGTGSAAVSEHSMVGC